MRTVLLAALPLALAACDSAAFAPDRYAPGQAVADTVVVGPDQLVTFDVLANDAPSGPARFGRVLVEPADTLGRLVSLDDGRFAFAAGPDPGQVQFLYRTFCYTTEGRLYDDALVTVRVAS